MTTPTLTTFDAVDTAVEEACVTLARASEALGEGDPGEAAGLLDQAHTLVASARGQLPAPPAQAAGSVDAVALRHHLTAALAALGDDGTPAHPGLPTQLSALRAAAALAQASPADASVTVDSHAYVYLQFGVGDAAQLAALAAMAPLLGHPRLTETEYTRRFHISVTGTYPGAKMVSLTAVLDAAPPAEALAGLRALCGIQPDAVATDA